MSITPIDTASSLSLRERNEKLLRRWGFLLEQGRMELHQRQWFIATCYYQQAMLAAELLFPVSLCKSCALRCYARTLVEYAYVECHINGADNLELIEQAATLTLSAYVPMPCVDKLLAPLASLKCQSETQREQWINQLFAADAQAKQQLH